MAVKILAVDDSATMRTIMQLTFAGEGAEVRTVGRGDQVVATAKEYQPDVIFADASMSPMDGYAVSHAIKSDAGLANVAVIVMASQHNPFDEGKGKTSGVDDHIAKPFDSQAVIDKVAQVLARPRAKAEGAPAAAPPAAAAAPPQAPARPAPPAQPTHARSAKRTMAFGQPAVQRPPAAPPQAPTPPTPPQPPAAAKPQLEVVEEEVDLVPGPTPAAPAKPAAPPAAPARSAPPAAAAATASGSDMAARLEGLGLTKDQVEGVLSISREVIEQVVWEVVPDLAETLIKEEIKRLTAE